MGFLRQYRSKYWKPFLAAVAFLMIETVCDLMQPTIMSKVIDVGVAGRDMKYILTMGAVMLAITAVGAAAAVTRNIISSNVSQKFGTELRSDLFKKIHSYSFENVDRFETASLVTRLTNDVTQVQGFVHGLMRIFVKAPLLCIGSVVMAVLLNPHMALVLIAVIPVIGLIIFFNMRTGYPYFMKVQKGLDRVNGVMREYLAGVRVVKAFNRFGYEVGRFAEANKGLSSASITAMRVMAIFSPGITLTVNMGIVAVLLLGGFRVNSGDIRVGQVIAFTNYMTQILFSLMMISFVFTMFVRARASAERIGEALEQESSIIVAEVPIEQGDTRGQVDFEEVCFSYTGATGEPVLKDITFSCKPGETLGIIGSTGSGKSSLVSLIPRFYDPRSGSVKVDGVDIRDMDPRKLREQISVVPQKTMLFTGTILENIRWGKENATEDEVEEAATAAQAYDFIAAFPEGYHTLLGQGGVNLSGGQKQRLAIARALVRKPRILILDDCTSAVDVITEAKIRQAVKDFSGEPITCIIIAQRITSVMGADRILVLDNGERAGMGTHQDLLQSCEIYRDIYRSQIGREEL
jgi:ATP-binding cassette, subfamily B, multidrug efflux pump